MELALPVEGDTIYDGADGLTTYDGASSLHKIGSGDDYVYVNSEGFVVFNGDCSACTETAVPVVNIPNFTFTVGEGVDIKLVGTNNPEEWTLISPCQSYSLSGGETGGVYTLTHCNGGSSFEVQVPKGGFRTVCSVTAPVLVTGSGATATLLGVCTDEILPLGLTINFRSGAIVGVPSETGVYRIVVTATNCFGTSNQDVFLITVGPATQYRRFNCDSSQPKSNASDACAVTPSYSIYYHDGEDEYPRVNDFVFFLNTETAEYLPYNGGYLWYLMDNNSSIRIDNIGQVTDISLCGETKSTEAGDDKTTEDDLEKTIE